MMNMPLSYNIDCVLLTALTGRKYTQGTKCPETQTTHSPGRRRDYRGVFIKSYYQGRFILSSVTFISSV